MPNDPWFNCLPGCETQVPCGRSTHAFRWAAGSLRLPEHPDAEGELVLAALGGEKARCIELAQAWGRHTEDLSVLAIGPRGPADQIPVSWDDVESAAQADRPGPAGHRGGRVVPRPAALRQLASPPPPAAGALSARRQREQEEAQRARLRRSDMLSLLALGYGFQVRLAGQVAAAHADRPDDRARPALVAAMTGRLALAAENWLGIDPDQVVVSLHTGPGWGATELTGRGEQRRLRVSLPAGWLARVWACGLTLTGGHLVVAVAAAGWPDARVLGLRVPGAEPVPLDVHASAPGPESGGRGSSRGERARDGLAGAGDAPHWEM
jgi:hypothetical protein